MCPLVLFFIIMCLAFTCWLIRTFVQKGVGNSSSFEHVLLVCCYLAAVFL